MTDFTPEELRTAAKVAETAGLHNYSRAWRSDRLERVRSEDAYLGELGKVYSSAYVKHAARGREGMRAVIAHHEAKLEADGWTRPPQKAVNQDVTPNTAGPWSDWRDVPEGIWYGSNRAGFGDLVWRNANGTRLLRIGDVWQPSSPNMAMAKYAPFHRVPRVWQKGDPEPEGVSKVLDATLANEFDRIATDKWLRIGRPSIGVAQPWGVLVQMHGPVTEVLS